MLQLFFFILPNLQNQELPNVTTSLLHSCGESSRLKWTSSDPLKKVLRCLTCFVLCFQLVKQFKQRASNYFIDEIRKWDICAQFSFPQKVNSKMRGSQSDGVSKSRIIFTYKHCTLIKPKQIVDLFPLFCICHWQSSSSFLLNSFSEEFFRVIEEVATS